MSDRKKYQAITRFLNDLVMLVAFAGPKEELDEKKIAYAGFLVDDFEAEYFCRSSLAYVKDQCQWFPSSYAELAGHLRAWKRAQPSPFVALPPSDSRGFPCFVQGCGEWFPTRELRREHSLHCTQNPPGAGLRWEQRMNELRAEWDDPEYIRAKVRECSAEWRLVALPRQQLAMLVARWAPQHFHLIPPTWAPNVSAEMDRAAKAELSDEEQDRNTFNTIGEVIAGIVGT